MSAPQTLRKGASQAQFVDWANQVARDIYGNDARSLSPIEADALYARYQAQGDFNSGQLLNDLSKLHGGRGTMGGNIDQGGVSAYTNQTNALLKVQNKPSIAAPTAPAPPPVGPTGQPVAGPNAAYPQTDVPSGGQLANGMIAAQLEDTSTQNLFGSQLDPNAPVWGQLKPLNDPNVPPPQRYATNGQPGAWNPQTVGNMTYNNWMTSLYGMSPQDLQNLKETLFQNHWYQGMQVKSVGELGPGVDKATLAAMDQVLTETARYNAAHNQDQNWRTWQDMAGSTAPYDPKAAKADAAGGGSHMPYPLTNPVDQKAAVQGVAEKLMGGGLSAAQTQGAMGYIQAQEMAGLQRYNNSAPETGQIGRTGYIEKPSPDAAAREYLLQNDQQDIRNYSMAYNALHFADMLKAL